MSPTRDAPPIVAILGRPNVGKSTLFNRYAGGRRALVEDTPGVTRDRIAELVEAGGRSVLVVDTAGLDPEPSEGGLSAAVQAQARVAVESADALLLVVDGKAGLLPQEELLARELRRTRKPVLVAVNKIDHPRHADRVHEFHALGLEPLRGISAEHGTGAWDALEELVAALPPPEGAEEAAGEGGEEAALRVAVVGRPNVGKSSLFNRLLGVERTVVSDVPGTTRDAIDLRVERDGVPWVFVDTAGLRRPGRRDRLAEPGSAVMTARALERADLAIVVADAAEGFTDRDVRILGLVRERGCAALLVLNKWDLVEGDPDRTRRVEAGVDRRLAGESDVRVLRVSSLTGAGAARVFPELERLGSAATREISTADLNQWLKEAVARHEPAMAQRGARRRPLRFLYATQTGVRPPSFVLFCSDPRGVQEGYRRYLENRLRERFGLAGVPVRLRLRGRRRAPGGA